MNAGIWTQQTQTSLDYPSFKINHNKIPNVKLVKGQRKHHTHKLTVEVESQITKKRCATNECIETKYD